MDQQIIAVVNDGQTVDRDFVRDWNIMDYCNQYNGSITISFVGAIIKNGKVLFSFPKHYKLENEEDKISCMKKILYILAKSKSSYGSFCDGINGEFPVKAYLEILMHYKKYGLYLSNEQYYEDGYAGNIDWNKTINKSNKIIQKKGIVFFPFVIKQTKDKSVFISECMSYVLSDASRYRDFINMIIPYDYLDKKNIFRNLNYVLNELKRIKNIYFKDIEKRLINNLIEYIKWKSTTNNNVRILTLKFENYWEEMINKYLNDNFVGINENRIIWGVNNKNKFVKPDMEYVESVEKIQQNKNRRPYKIQYDHILIDDSSYKIVIFDSKYFNSEVEQLNYKQLFYHYNLKQKYPEYHIENGLLLPTHENYYTKIHIDRTDLDGIKIIEHYINLNLVLDNYCKSV